MAGRPRGQDLSRNRLTERDPEAVQVADDDFAHAVEHVVRPLHDLDSILDSVVEVVDFLGRRSVAGPVRGTSGRTSSA